MKQILKEQASKLRKSGHSFREISEELKISKSTASLWTRAIVLNNEGRKRLKDVSDLGRLKSNMTAHEKRLKRLDIAEKEAGELLNKVVLNRDSSLIALCIMYWCEGAKKDQNISFTNSDPYLLKAFINMFIEVFSADKNKIKIKLQLHDYHDHQELLDFWSKTLGMPLNQFTKIYEKKSNHKFSAKGYKGCATLTYYNAHLARVVLSFAKNFIKLYI